jgi:hypothetical protein
MRSQDLLAHDLIDQRVNYDKRIDNLAKHYDDMLEDAQDRYDTKMTTMSVLLIIAVGLLLSEVIKFS